MKIENYSTEQLKKLIKYRGWGAIMYLVILLILILVTVYHVQVKGNDLSVGIPLVLFSCFILLIAGMYFSRRMLVKELGKRESGEEGKS